MVDVITCAPGWHSSERPPSLRRAQAGSFVASLLKQWGNSRGLLPCLSRGCRQAAVSVQVWVIGSSQPHRGQDACGSAGNVDAAPKHPCWRALLRDSAQRHAGIARVWSSMRISMPCCSAVCTNCLPPARFCSCKLPAPSPPLRPGHITAFSLSNLTMEKDTGLGASKQCNNSKLLRTRQRE